MPDTGADRPILLVQDGKDAEQKQVPIAKDEFILGRGDDCDVVLPFREVSRHHVKIYREGEAYYLQDLDSKNGTWLNDKQITGTHRLNDNDRIELAKTAKLIFLGTGATAPLPFEVPRSLGGKLRLDQEARRVFIGDQEIDPPLSPPQYRLLELLYNNTGRICTRDTVVETVWPDALGEGVSEQAIDALVRRLRDRLAEIDPGWQYIVTVRGHGFRLDNS